MKYNVIVFGWSAWKQKGTASGSHISDEPKMTFFFFLRFPFVCWFPQIKTNFSHFMTPEPQTDPRSQLGRNFACIQLIWRQGREWDSEPLDLDLAGGQRTSSTCDNFQLKTMNIRTATGQWLLSAISDSITLNMFYPWIILDDVFCFSASCQTWHNPTFCSI